MNKEYRSNKSVTGLKRKRKALSSECNDDLKSCSVRVVKLGGDGCASYVEDHTGSVSKVNLLNNGNEVLVDQDSDSSATEIATNSYTTVEILQNNCKGVDTEALETDTSKNYSFHSIDSLEKSCHSNAVVNPNMKNKDVHDDRHVSFNESTEQVSYKKDAKNNFSKRGKSVSNCNTIKNLHNDDDLITSSCSENENEAIHKHSDTYCKRERYSVDNVSKINTSCNKKKPSSSMEPLSQSTDYGFKKCQNLKSATAMYNIKPCSVILTRTDIIDSTEMRLRNESKDVIKKVPRKETKSRLVDAYMKHNKRIKRRMQKRAEQEYQNSKLISRLNVTNRPVSCTSSEDEDTIPSRYDASGTRSKNHKIRQNDYQNHRNYGSNHNSTYFNESLPSTSSSSIFDEMEDTWPPNNEYLRRKYPEYFDLDCLRDKKRARNIVKRINEISLCCFNKRFDPRDYISKDTEDISEEDDTSNSNSRDSSEHSFNNEHSSGLEEDSSKDGDFTGKNKKAYKRKMQENGGDGSSSESESVEVISDNESCHENVSHSLQNTVKTFDKAVQCGARGKKKNLNETSPRNMSSTSSTDKNSKKPKCAMSGIKRFHNQFGRQYIVDYFNIQNINKLFVCVPLRDELFSLQKQTECDQNSENKPISWKCKECGNILETEPDSKNKPNIVSETFNSPGPSNRENDEILSGSPNPAINFSNDHENEKLSVTIVISPSKESSPSRPCDNKVLSNSNNRESASSNKSSEDELSDSTIITVNKNDSCVHCCYTFLNKADTYNHTCPGKREKGFLCMYCERIFSSDGEFEAHSKMHVIST